MTEERPVIEFPCPYPIKVMGLHENDFARCVLDIVRQHDPRVAEEHITYRESSNGKYLSVNITITANSPEHIRELFEALKASGRVSMVL